MVCYTTRYINSLWYSTTMISNKRVLLCTEEPVMSGGSLKCLLTFRGFSDYFGRLREGGLLLLPLLGGIVF